MRKLARHDGILDVEIRKEPTEKGRKQNKKQNISTNNSSYPLSLHNAKGTTNKREDEHNTLTWTIHMCKQSGLGNKTFQTWMQNPTAFSYLAFKSNQYP